MLRIRKAIQQEVEAICDVFCEYIDFHYQFDPSYKRAKNAHKVFAGFISSQISSRKALVLVAIKDQKIVGYLNASITLKPPVFETRRYGIIYDLAVTSSQRRLGIGTELYQNCLEWFETKNLDRIELGVTTTNPISNKFWKKMGYLPYYKKLYKVIS